MTKITKKQSLVLALATLASFFVIAFLLAKGEKQASESPENRAQREALLAYYKGATPQPTGAVSAPRPNTSPSASPSLSRFMLHNFERSETRDGRKLWEVKAATGEYFTESNSARVTDAQVWLYRPNGKVVRMEADSAVLHLTGASLDKADAEGHVTIYYEDVTVKTAHAIYDKPNNKVEAPGFVKITSAAMDISGTSLKVNLLTNDAELEHQVESVIRPKSERPSTVAAVLH